MNNQNIAIIIQESGKFISNLLKTRPPKKMVEQQPPIMSIAEPQEVSEEDKEQKIEEGTACLPCVNGHFSTCSGLISDEAIRMARRHGIGDEEISRINKCLDQLNAMEREDLSAEKIQNLPSWEKEIAIYAQNESARIRHDLENIASVDGLEIVAVKIKNARMKVGQDYFKGKLANMPEEKKKELARQAIKKLIEEE